jgi:hypothetical protein
MKRTAVILSAGLIGLLPLSLTQGQEKKSEDKIKIIIVDKDGAKTIIDTTFTGSDKPDSIRLKNGSVVYIGKPGHGRGNEGSSVVDISGDNLYVYTGSENESTGKGKRYKVITRVEKDADKPVSKYIYINSDRDMTDIDNGKFDVSVDEDEFDNDSDKVRNVIAKDGIVVTIEGKDEEKVQALAKEIEKAMDASLNKSPAGDSGKPTGKKK